MRTRLRPGLVRRSVFTAGAAILAGSAPAFAGSASDVAAGPVPVFFDLRPTQCPNRLYAGPFRGVEILPAAILGTDDVAAANIASSSLLLIVPGGGGFGEIGIPPLGSDPEDVATPVADPSNCNCTVQGPDVEVDLTMEFDAAAVVDALELVHPGNVNPGVEFELCITGEFLDGTPFRGCDCVLVDTPPVPVSPESWGRVKSGYR